jgi:hypothetical protein
LGAFDFEDRTRAALPEESRAEQFLITYLRIVVIVVRGGHSPMAYTPELLRCKNKTSIERLVLFLTELGRDVEIKISRSHSDRKGAVRVRSAAA